MIVSFNSQYLHDTDFKLSQMSSSVQRQRPNTRHMYILHIFCNWISFTCRFIDVINATPSLQFDANEEINIDDLSLLHFLVSIHQPLSFYLLLEHCLGWRTAQRFLRQTFYWYCSGEQTPLLSFRWSRDAVVIGSLRFSEIPHFRQYERGTPKLLCVHLLPQAFWLQRASCFCFLSK